MTDELKQLAAEYQRRMSWLIDEPTNWTLFLEDFGREVQRQTAEAAKKLVLQYSEMKRMAGRKERYFAARRCAEIIKEALLSPSQEVTK